MPFPSTLDTSDPQKVYHFLGGRAFHNWKRGFIATHRRMQVIEMWVKNPHLSRAAIARELKVNRSTVTRDLQRLKRDCSWRGKCPVCDRPWYKPDETIKMMELLHGLEMFHKQTKRKFPHLF